MDGYSGSSNAGSSSWPSFSPFEVSVYLRDYAGSLDAPRFQAMPTRGYSRNVHDVRHGVNCGTQVGAWINRRIALG